MPNFHHKTVMSLATCPTAKAILIISNINVNYSMKHASTIFKFTKYFHHERFVKMGETLMGDICLETCAL